jgi:hypothetical protein
MLGNVWEWCADEWHSTYNGAPTDGSAWIGTSRHGGAANRVVRGGSWHYFARLVRAAYRSQFDPADRDGGIGFRCARVQNSDESSIAKRRAGRSKPGERSETAATTSPERSGE